jgi:hypothetical protein
VILQTRFITNDTILHINSAIYCPFSIRLNCIYILLKNVFFQEVKNNIAHALQKEKNVGETVAFALNEMASLADVRKRKIGIVRNAKAYKIPKNLLGTDLCHFIEHGKYIIYNCKCLNDIVFMWY